MIIETKFDIGELVTVTKSKVTRVVNAVNVNVKVTSNKVIKEITYDLMPLHSTNCDYVNILEEQLISQ